MTDAAGAVRTALIAQLRASRALAGIDGREGGPESGALPRVAIEPFEVSDWGMKGATGREVRTAMTVRVARGQSLRLPMLADALARAGEALGGNLGGWHVASAVLLRAKTVDRNDGTQVARVEHRVRVLRV